MEFFLHPWYMVGGGVLIILPILIHLINRMRFKRIRWAAMEFLLKSQKRNRRKLIIEQMILLLLRILLVLLAGYLMARFLPGCQGGKRGASHVVIVDDTLSLFDRDREGGKDSLAYETAIEQVKELARNAAEASSKQQMKIFLLSDIAGKPIYDERLSDRSVEEIDRKFAQSLRKPSLLHASPYHALQKGRQVLATEEGDGQKILHFVSDFRDRDWTTGPDADKLHDEIRGILDAGINLNLIDVAKPERTARSKAVNNNGNISILDLKAESRVAVEDALIEFKLLLMNHGQAKEKSFIRVEVNGQHDLTSDYLIEDLEPGTVKEHTFTLRFNLSRRGTEITEKDSVEEREKKRRLEREQFHIRVMAGMSAQPEGLMADNVRDLVMEVRRKVPTLVVDGNRPEGKGEGSDMFHFQSFFAASVIYEIEERALAGLEKADLDLYPSIVLLNVGEIPEAVVKKLKAYVENGGSLCYFMGEEVRPEHYNNVLYKNGIFPLLINDRPFDPLMATGMVDPDLRRKERERLRQAERTPKILFPRQDHPLVRPLVPFTTLFRYMSVNVYWQAQPRSRWDPDLRKTEPLIVLPNTSTIDKYRARAVQLSQAALSQTELLAGKEPEYKKYVKPMEEYKNKVRGALSVGELYRLGEVLEEMRTNPGVESDPDKPNMADLWKQQDMKALGDEIREFRETVLYGDPLFVSKQQGKGRVAAFLTTAGTAPRRGVGEDAVSWNNWGAGEISIQNLYPLFLLQLQRFLVSEGQAPQRLLGEEVRFTLDANRYSPEFEWKFTPQPDMTLDPPPKVQEETYKGTLQKEEGNQMTFVLKDPKPTFERKPGFYRVSLTLADDDRKEERAFAFNVDSAAEGDLKRANRDRLEPEFPPGDAKRGRLALRVPGESYEQFKERQQDASESPLLYLFFLLILVVEQAMAVHLSFHTRGEQGLAAAPARRAA